MRAWRLPAGSDGFNKMYLEELPDPTPGPGEVLIQVHACSINYRDFAVAAGKYFGGAIKAPAIPLSDGAGQVIAVGPRVTRFKEGDRVQSALCRWPKASIIRRPPACRAPASPPGTRFTKDRARCCPA